MVKIKIDQVLDNCTKNDPKRRITNLNSADLKKIWNECAEFVREKVQSRKTVVFPEIGMFALQYKKRLLGIMDTKHFWTPLFIPSKTLENHLALNDNFYKGDYKKVIPQGSIYLNYHSIAENMDICRNTVQLGLTEIINEIFRLISKNHEIILIFSKFCRVSMQRGNLNVKFHKKFLELLSKTPGSADDDTPQLLAAKKFNPTQESLASNATEEFTSIPSVEFKEPEKLVEVVCNPDASMEVVEHLKPELEQVSVKEPLTYAKSSGETLDEIIAETRVLSDAINEASSLPKRDQEKKSRNIDTTLPARFEGKHKHYFSGDRLWSNENCCICRQETSSSLSSLRPIDKLNFIEDKIFNNLFKNDRVKPLNFGPGSATPRIISAPNVVSKKLAIGNTFRITSSMAKQSEISQDDLDLLKEELIGIDKGLYSKKIANVYQKNDEKIRKIDDYDFTRNAKNESVILQSSYIDHIKKSKELEKERKQREIKTSLEASIKIQKDLMKDYEIEKSKKVKIRRSLESFWKNQAKVKQLKESLYL